MNIMTKLVTLLPIITPIFSILFSVIATSYFNKKNSEEKYLIEVRKDRFTKVVLPCFQIIESELFLMNPKRETIEKLLDVFNQYPHYSGVLLINLAKECLILDSSKLDFGKEFGIICSEISYDYDRLCKLFDLRPRSTNYRIERNQYSSKFDLAYAKFMIKLKLFALFSIVALYVVIYIGFTSAN